MHRKRVIKTFRYSWVLIGIALISVILISMVEIHVASGKGVTQRTIFFAAGLYALLIYLILTMILVLIREIIKRLRS